MAGLTPSLVPRRTGPERLSLGSDGAVALAGTGFDPDSRQHRLGSDAARYAIALQQARDDRDYAAADAMRAEVVAQGFEVRQEPGGTRVVCARSRFRIWRTGEATMVLSGGVLFDLPHPQPAPCEVMRSTGRGLTASPRDV